MDLNACISSGTVPDVDGLIDLISSRCRQKTRDTLNRRLTTQVSLLRQYGIFTRMTYGENGWDYCCVQSWNDEMRTIRESLIDGLM